MVGGGEVLRIGPFSGGLNLASDAASIADSELAICKNFELDIDGSLKSRPPIHSHGTTTINDGLLIIGSAAFAGVGYLFASSHVGSNTIYQSSNGTTWASILAATDHRGGVALQYANKVWIVVTPQSTSSGGNWDPTVGFTADADIPKGVAAVVHKERLYIVPGPDATTNSSRLFFSEPGDLGNWPGTNFIDVSPGDGETLNDVIVYNDNLLLFKTNSVYVLAYDLNPSEAILREINPVIGVERDHQVVQFENVVYMLHKGTVYEVVNYDFNPINVKVPFVLDATLPSGATSRVINTSLSLMGERLIVRFFRKTYVFGLRTRTWSEWECTGTNQNHEIGPLYQLPSGAGTVAVYYAFRVFNNSDTIFSMRDLYNATNLDAGVSNLIICTAKTKDFDMADPVHYKKLFWWSADVLAGNQIKGTATTIVQQSVQTWDTLGTLTWAQLGNWANVSSTLPSVLTTISGDNNSSVSKTVKFLKTLRFRKVNFEVTLETDGTSTDGQAKLFSMTATMRSKATVPKQVS